WNNIDCNFETAYPGNFYFLLDTHSYSDQNFTGNGPSIQLRGQKLPLLQRLNGGLGAGILCTDAAQRLQLSGFINNAAHKNWPLPCCKLCPVDSGGHFLLREWRHQQACARISMIQHGILHRPIWAASGITHGDGYAENSLITIEDAHVPPGPAAAPSGNYGDAIRPAHRS